MNENTRKRYNAQHNSKHNFDDFNNSVQVKMKIILSWGGNTCKKISEAFCINTFHWMVKVYNGKYRQMYAKKKEHHRIHKCTLHQYQYPRHVQLETVRSGVLNDTRKRTCKRAWLGKFPCTILTRSTSITLWDTGAGWYRTGWFKCAYCLIIFRRCYSAQI